MPETSRSTGKIGEYAMAFTINVNSRTHSVDVDGDTPPHWLLRDILRLTGKQEG